MGRVGGKLVKPDFAFGPFKDYIVEGKMPAEAELGTLQRQWDDVATIAEMLATNGVAELLDVGFANVNRDQGSGIGDQEKNGKAKKGMGNKKATKGATKGSDPSSLIPDPSSHSYVFTFAAKPAAFIQTLNELEASERFITVDSFTFVRPVDVIAAALGGDDKKSAEAQSSGRRGRRGRRGAEAEAPASKLAGTGEEAGKNGLVTDPLKDDPLTVTMTVTVHDFRSLEESGEADSSPLQKGTSK